MTKTFEAGHQAGEGWMKNVAVALCLTLPALPASATAAMPEGGSGRVSARDTLELLKRLKKASGDDGEVRESAIEPKAEVIRPPERPVKIRLAEGEFRRLLAVAEAVLKAEPKAKKGIGSNVVRRMISSGYVHEMTVYGSCGEGGSSGLESVVLERTNANMEFVRLSILPDGRAAETALVREGWQVRVAPLAEEKVQEALRGELEFWLWGEGWNETTGLRLKPGRHRVPFWRAVIRPGR